MNNFEIGDYIYVDADGNQFKCKIVEDDRMPYKKMVVFEDPLKETEWPEVLKKSGNFEKIT